VDKGSKLPPTIRRGTITTNVLVAKYTIREVLTAKLWFECRISELHRALFSTDTSVLNELLNEADTKCILLAVIT
jgi:hypothetical protein